MGYGSTAKFVQYLDVFTKHGVPRNGSIMTLGDQTVPIPDKQCLKYIQQFVSHYSTYKAEDYEACIGKRIHVRHVYADAGFDFSSIDLNQIDQSIPVDLNIWPNDRLPDRQFDVVTNEGTTEHVTNQMNAFCLIHYLARSGGIMIHEIPILHFGAHAMVTITPLFLKKLIDGNNYEIIQARLNAHNVGDWKAYHHHHGLEFLENFTQLIERSTLAAMAYLVLRKRDDAAFVPPLDIALGANESLAVLDSYIDCYRGRSTDAQVERAKKRLRSKAPMATDEITARIDDRIKTFDRDRHTALATNLTAAKQSLSNTGQNVSPQEITVTLRFAFSLRKSLLAIGIIAVSCTALFSAALVLSAIITR